MLKPNYFNGKSDRVVSLYQSFEDYLIQDIAKFLINAGETSLQVWAGAKLQS